MKKEIAKFIEESVEWLKEEQCGCCKYQLDDHLGIFVGWSAGYGDEKRDDVIQAEDSFDWGIDVGIKVWTSDYMQTDYDYLNFPYYENGDVLDMSLSVAPNEDYENLAQSLLKWYEEVEDLEMNDSGLISEVKTRYYVCGIGYDEHESITDYEESFGDFDTYEEAYELFVKLQCRKEKSFFENTPDLCQLLIQLEKCKETDDEIECIDVTNEWWVVNPLYIPKDKIMVAVLNEDYYLENGSYPEEYSSNYAHESYTFDTPEEFIKKWYELDEGAWYWVFANGDEICSGAVDPNDIEIFEDYFDMSFEEEDDMSFEEEEC